MVSKVQRMGRNKELVGQLLRTVRDIKEIHSAYSLIFSRHGNFLIKLGDTAMGELPLIVCFSVNL